jgi:hypothetical protein
MFTPGTTSQTGICYATLRFFLTIDGIKLFATCFYFHVGFWNDVARRGCIVWGKGDRAR